VKLLDTQQREALERRLAQIDSAVDALRRGALVSGGPVPGVCDEIFAERAEILRQLGREPRVVAVDAGVASRPAGQLPPPPEGPHRAPSNFWNRCRVSLCRLFGWQRRAARPSA
jgi:hypothetical protein